MLVFLKYSPQVTDVDIKSIFNLVDIDKSGTVSRTVRVIFLLSKGGKAIK